MALFDKCFFDKSKDIAIIRDKNNCINVEYALQTQNFKVSLLSLSDNMIFHSPEITFFKNYYPDSIVHPVKYFLISGFGLINFERTLIELKYSIWWNVYGFFMIENLKTNSCNDAYYFLKTAWTFNILRILFLCKDKNSEIHMYTFNPYASKPQKKWFLVESFGNENGHMSVFRRPLNLKG